MRLIDADALMEIYARYEFTSDMGDAMEILSNFPTVDAVPVIRCKDCKYYRADGDCWHEWDNDGRIYYQSVINEPNPDDYCSRAERKEDE
jgi:hypothetical protein